MKKLDRVNKVVDHTTFSTEDIAQLVRKYFEPEIREVLSEVSESISRHQQQKQMQL